jgi:hypothetical protein
LFAKWGFGRLPLTGGPHKSPYSLSFFLILQNFAREKYGSRIRRKDKE